ncbi:hypothetical protein POM88_052751 [Heracleum sosnowskyi]|uniref:Importin subunit beta-1/Transportin-1-like TPR repeats domain-containing protein n=1 Tax=Heracleum sosnowskyi TaxID=360622 RepID=A0AAD8GQX1_9APIA|nr:hypothetical protein POM88_052751 [Heracleum sosnowskyi]
MVIRDGSELQVGGELRASFFGVLQVTIRKLGDVVNMDPAVLQVGDEVADLLSMSFRRRRVSKVYKEEMLVTGALAYAVGAEFVKYMSCLYPCLSLGLQNFEEHQVCSASVGAVGYIFLALREFFLPHCHEIMNHLKHLTSSEVHHSVKPFVFLFYGNIVVPIGGHFEEYFQDVVKKMQDVLDVYAYSDDSDDDMVEYGNRLRRTTCETFIGHFEEYFQDVVKKMQDVLDVYAYSDDSDDDTVEYGNWLRRTTCETFIGIVKGRGRDQSNNDIAGGLANALYSKLKTLLLGGAFFLD